MPGRIDTLGVHFIGKNTITAFQRYSWIENHLFRHHHFWFFPVDLAKWKKIFGQVILMSWCGNPMTYRVYTGF